MPRTAPRCTGRRHTALIPVHLALDPERQATLGEARSEIAGQATRLSCARQLRKRFRVIIRNAVHSVPDAAGRQAQAVMAAAGRQMAMFFAEALQLEPRIIQHEHGLDAPAGG